MWVPCQCSIKYWATAKSHFSLNFEKAEEASESGEWQNKDLWYGRRWQMYSKSLLGEWCLSWDDRRTLRWMVKVERKKITKKTFHQISTSFSFCSLTNSTSDGAPLSCCRNQESRTTFHCRVTSRGFIVIHRVKLFVPFMRVSFWLFFFPLRNFANCAKILSCYFLFYFFLPLNQTEGHRFRSVYCECVCCSVRSQKREKKMKWNEHKKYFWYRRKTSRFS